MLPITLLIPIAIFAEKDNKPGNVVYSSSHGKLILGLLSLKLYLHLAGNTSIFENMNTFMRNVSFEVRGATCSSLCVVLFMYGLLTISLRAMNFLSFDMIIIWKRWRCKGVG
jgi:hypothetical protein